MRITISPRNLFSSLRAKPAAGISFVLYIQNPGFAWKIHYKQEWRQFLHSLTRKKTMFHTNQAVPSNEKTNPSHKFGCPITRKSTSRAVFMKSFRSKGGISAMAMMAGHADDSGDIQKTAPYFLVIGLIAKISPNWNFGMCKSGCLTLVLEHSIIMSEQR